MYSGEVISILGSFKFNAYMVMQVLNYICVYTIFLRRKRKNTHTRKEKEKKHTKAEGKGTVYIELFFYLL